MARTLSKKEVAKRAEDAKERAADASRNGWDTALDAIRNLIDDAPKYRDELADATKRGGKEAKQGASKGIAVAVPIVMSIARNKKARGGALFFVRKHPVMLGAAAVMAIAGVRKLRQNNEFNDQEL